LTGPVAGQAGMEVNVQIRRRDPGAGAPNLQTDNVEIEEVAFEDYLWDQVRTESTDTAASQVWRPTNGFKLIPLAVPLVFVRPYFFKARHIVSSAVAQTVSSIVQMSLLIESLRIDSSSYTKLLNNYTRSSPTIERRTLKVPTVS